VSGGQVARLNREVASSLSIRAVKEVFSLGMRAVDGATSQPCEGTRAGRITGSRRRPVVSPVAKFQAIGNKTLAAEIFGHRTEDVLEKLADEDDAVAVTHRFNQFVHGFTAHFWVSVRTGSILRQGDRDDLG